MTAAGIRFALRFAFGLMVSMVLMVIALWAWRDAGALAADATRPDVQRWAVRSAAVSAAAIAQIVILSVVASRVYRSRGANRRSFAGDLLRTSAGIVAAVALVSAVALGLAGR